MHWISRLPFRLLFLGIATLPISLPAQSAPVPQPSPTFATPPPPVILRRMPGSPQIRIVPAPQPGEEAESTPLPPPSGIGAGLGVDNAGGLAITMVVPGAPAERAGIQTGDVILQANGFSLIGQPIERAVELIKGPPGTPVVLFIFRPGEPHPRELVLLREPFIATND